MKFPKVVQNAQEKKIQIIQKHNTWVDCHDLQHFTLEPYLQTCKFIRLMTIQAGYLICIHKNF